jgi:hypothetical protein
MLGEGGTDLQKLEQAVVEFRARDDRRVDPRRLRAVIDALEREFAEEAVNAKRSGDHLLAGAASVVGWLGRTCGLSSTAAADRLCVGEQLEALPRLAEALSAGEVGYQSVSLLCHLRDQLGEKRHLFIEEDMLQMARDFTVKKLRFLCRYARHVADPDGFFNESEADFDNRRLHISQLPNGMHSIEGILDAIGGAALKTALESLARHLGPDDRRSYRQRMADALAELTQHALDEGRLPRRGGVRPHINVTTTLEGLQNQAGCGPAEVEQTLPVSTRTLERIACDSSISRVLRADSTIIDVGKATRVVSGPMRRGLKARDRHCRWPGCERPISWTNPHHIVFVSRGGQTNLNNLVSLCYFHHRLVHEAGWQVVRVGTDLRFIPPERTITRTRGPSWRRYAA